MKVYKYFQSLLCFLSLIFINYAEAQYITVDTSSYTAAQIVANFIGTTNASCITVSNVSVTGKDFGNGNVSYGYFDKGTSSFSIGKGIILSTGSAKVAEGYYTGTQTHNNSAPFYDPSWAGDQDLSDAIQQTNIYNATSLEFDFVTSLSNKISFDYLFASDEYYAGNKCNYSDAFAFLIKEANDPVAQYKNIAVIPGTQQPVSSTSVNPQCNMNVDYFDNFNTLNDPNVPFNFGGQTIIMTAQADITPGVKYHIKLVIGDQGTDRGKYDSAVFLKEGSFTGNIDLLPNIASNDAAIICNNVPVILQPKNPTDINDPLAIYDWFKDGVDINIHTPTLQTKDPGTYKLKVTLSSLCTLEANIKLINAPVATFNLSPVQLCDNDFDLDYTTNLSFYNSSIVTNYDSSIFDVLFYDNPAGTGAPITSFNFTQPSKTLYVKANAYTCDSGLPKPVQFVHGNQLGMNYPQSQTTVPAFDICDGELTGSKVVDLKAFVDNVMTTETGTDKSFYKTEAQAKKGDLSTAITDVNPKFSSTNSDQTYFVRIERASTNSCPNYSSFRLLFKQPKKSTVLKDTLICKGSFADLNAGLGFNSYKWHKKNDPAIISTSHDATNLQAGDYTVELGFNGCIYSQSVKISEPADLTINNILIEGNKVTVLAADGIPPYRYKLDNGNYQVSNIFENVPVGGHTIDIMDACGSVMRDFSIINAKNAITPNGDGLNDFVDYSDLMTKLEPRFEVYDRFGVLVFKGDTNNNFIWNGKQNGRTLPTASYWYILEWNENGNPQRVQNTGWILLKNRN